MLYQSNLCLSLNDLGIVADFANTLTHTQVFVKQLVF